MKNILIFDYDGVLVDSLVVFRDSLLSACRKNGFELDENKFLDLFKINMFEGLIASGISKDKIPRIMMDLKETLIQAQNKMKLFDGIAAMLQELSKHNEIVVVTSNVSEVVEKFLASKDVSCIADIVGGEKESSKVLKIEKIKEKHPNIPSFYIGDTTGDIVEGKKAGAKTIAVTWGWHSRAALDAEHPDYIVDSPEELTGLFADSL